MYTVVLVFYHPFSIMNLRMDCAVGAGVGFIIVAAFRRKRHGIFDEHGFDHTCI
jgi:hypothetical protein